MESVTAMHWQCYECNMTFSNPQLLQKHRARFCVGGWGDPDQLMLRRGFRSEYPPQGGDLPDDYEKARERKFYGEPKKDYRSVRRKPDPARYNPNADPKVQQLAENHGRQMEHLQNRNRDLERQRDEIRRRLDDLGRRPTKGDDDSMNALFKELKDQEARNQKMLEELRRILASQNYPIPVTETKKQQYIYPIYYGNSLVAEIAAVRQAYLQNGGNDPDILQQLAQMQAEAQAIEDSLRNKPTTIIKTKGDPNSNKLFTLELENERLQRQLLLLQDQNVAAKNRRNGDREDDLEREIRRMHHDHLRKMYELQREIERLRHESIYIHHEKQPKIVVHQPPPIHISSPAPPAPQPQPVAATQFVEVDRLAPYDYSPRQPYAHTWAKTHYRQDINSDPYYELQL